MVVRAKSSRPVAHITRLCWFSAPAAVAVAAATAAVPTSIIDPRQAVTNRSAPPPALRGTVTRATKNERCGGGEDSGEGRRESAPLHNPGHPVQRDHVSRAHDTPLALAWQPKRLGERKFSFGRCSYFERQVSVRRLLLLHRHHRVPPHPGKYSLSLPVQRLSVRSKGRKRIRDRSQYGGGSFGSIYTHVYVYPCRRGGRSSRTRATATLGSPDDRSIDSIADRS